MVFLSPETRTPIPGIFVMDTIENTIIRDLMVGPFWNDLDYLAAELDDLNELAGKLPASGSSLANRQNVMDVMDAILLVTERMSDLSRTCH